MGNINLGQSSCLNLDTERNVEKNVFTIKFVCESSINFQISLMRYQ